MLAGSKAGAKDCLTSAAGGPVSAFRKYKLVSSVLIFISLRFCIDHNHLAHNAFIPHVRDTVSDCKGGRVKLEFFQLSSCLFDLCLHTVTKKLHGFQIILCSYGFCWPWCGKRIIVIAVADYIRMFRTFIDTENNFFLSDVDTLFHSIVADHPFFVIHQHHPFFVFSCSARLRFFGYRHRRKSLTCPYIGDRGRSYSHISSFYRSRSSLLFCFGGEGLL